MGSTYTIGQDGPDGRWRAYWLDGNGYGREQLFRSEFEAKRWVEFMESFE